MSTRNFGWSLMALLLAASAALAQDKLYRVVDKYGNVSYQDSPPLQDGVVVEERRNAFPVEPAPPPITVDQRIARASQEYPLVLFRVSECDSCDYVSWFLERRDLPFETVDVETDIGNQMRLKEATGEYRVPVLIIGEERVFGFDSDSLEAGLVAAGYLEAPPQAAERDGAVDSPTPEVIPLDGDPPQGASDADAQ